MEEKEDEETLKFDSSCDVNENDGYPSFCSSEYFTACSQLDQSFLNVSSEISKKELLKRSISNSSFEQEGEKRSKTTLFSSSQLDNSFLKCKKSIRSDEVWNLDERFSKKFYYNRIDESDFDLKTYVKSILERLIDFITLGKYRYTLEHYYHLERKKLQVEKQKILCDDFRLRLDTFIQEAENNPSELIWNELHKQTAERRLDDQIQIKNINEDDLESFKMFLFNLYQNYFLID